MTSSNKQAFHAYENVVFSNSEVGNPFSGSTPSQQAQQVNEQHQSAVVATSTNGNNHTTTMQSSASTVVERSTIDSPFPDPLNGVGGNCKNDISNSSDARNSICASISAKAPTASTSNAVSIVTKLIPSSLSPMDSFREWSITTFKCTKQLINEKRGKCSMTSDVYLKEDIDKLKNNQRKLITMLNIAQAMNTRYTQLVAQQKQMLDVMNELSVKFYSTSSSKSNSTLDRKSNRRIVANFSSLGNNLSATTESTIKNSNDDFSPILEHIKTSSSNFSIGEDFRKNAISLNAIAKNGEKLIAALTFFCSNLSTLIYKTIEDTLSTIQVFDEIRLEYDAERNSVSHSMPTNTQTSSIIFPNDKLETARKRYEQLRDDVQIKLGFLEENIMKVMQKQLSLFHGALSAYSSGNTAALDAVLKKYCILQAKSNK